MRQKGVTKEALSFVKKHSEELVNKQGLTLKKAFYKCAGGIEGLTLSGRTLRKVFEGVHIHTNSIELLIKELGGETFLNKDKIDIKNEEQKEDNSEAIPSNE